MFYIFSDPEIPEHKVDIEQPIPDHKFVYKDHEVQRGPKKGEMKKTVTLIIPPFLFRRKSDALITQEKREGGGVLFGISKRLIIRVAHLEVNFEISSCRLNPSCGVII